MFITVQDTGGDFGLAGNNRAWLGGLSGLAKTASLEWPDASVRAIDIERGERAPEAIAQALGDEIWLGGSELEVGLSKEGRRITLQSPSLAVGVVDADKSLGEAADPTVLNRLVQARSRKERIYILQCRCVLIVTVRRAKEIRFRRC